MSNSKFSVHSMFSYISHANSEHKKRSILILCHILIVRLIDRARCSMDIQHSKKLT